jgi:hypothetical protein
VLAADAHLSASTCLEIYKVPAPSHTRETCEHKHLNIYILWLYSPATKIYTYTKLKSATSKPRVYKTLLMGGEPRAFGVPSKCSLPLFLFSLSRLTHTRETLAHIMIIGYQISCVHVFKSERALVRIRT